MAKINLNQLTALDRKAHESCTSPLNDLPAPTKEQKDSGDYQKGHLKFLGIPIAIENPAGSERSGVDPNGVKWVNEMSHHYGYIENTLGVDGDEVDVFLKNGIVTYRDGTVSAKGPVYVIHQVNPDGTLDEHKVVMGADDVAEAKRIYLSNYAKGWDGIGKIVEYTLHDFKSKFLPKYTEQSSFVETSAVKTPAEKFTWMRYKGTKAKVLTHTKRNGDEVRTRLEPNDVYGYRIVKFKGNPQVVAQVVLKSDGMMLSYKILEKTFNRFVLKVSKPSTLPKALRTIDTTLTDKVAPTAPKKRTASKPSAGRKTDAEIVDDPSVLTTPVVNTKVAGENRATRKSRLESFVKRYFETRVEDDTCTVTIDTDTPRQTTYSIHENGNSAYVGLMFDQLMDEMVETFGRKPKVLHTEFESRSRSSYITVQTKTLDKTVFTQRTRTVETQAQTKTTFVELTFSE